MMRGPRISRHALTGSAAAFSSFAGKFIFWFYIEIARHIDVVLVRWWWHNMQYEHTHSGKTPEADL